VLGDGDQGAGAGGRNGPGRGEANRAVERPGEQQPPYETGYWQLLAVVSPSVKGVNIVTMYAPTDGVPCKLSRAVADVHGAGDRIALDFHSLEVRQEDRAINGIAGTIRIGASLEKLPWIADPRREAGGRRHVAQLDRAVEVREAQPQGETRRTAAVDRHAALDRRVIEVDVDGMIGLDPSGDRGRGEG
jgi:hypothetical protein